MYVIVVLPSRSCISAKDPTTGPKDGPVWKWDVDEFTGELYYAPDKDGRSLGLYTTDSEDDDNDRNEGDNGDDEQWGCLFVKKGRGIRSTGEDT